MTPPSAPPWRPRASRPRRSRTAATSSTRAGGRRPRRARRRRRAHPPRRERERRAGEAVLRPHRGRARRAARQPRGGLPMTAVAAPLAAGRDARPGLGRLTAVELRKMTDTRAGFWLQLAVVGLTLTIAGLIIGFGDPQDQTLAKMLQGTIQPSINLLPVIGILLVSSEWSQRTAQISFTLVPRRPRVIAAKLLAALVVAVAAFAV